MTKTGFHNNQMLGLKDTLVALVAIPGVCILTNTL